MPVKDRLGEHVAALGMAFPAGSLKKEEQKGLITFLFDCAKEIEMFGVENWQ